MNNERFLAALATPFVVAYFTWYIRWYSQRDTTRSPTHGSFVACITAPMFKVDPENETSI